MIHAQTARTCCIAPGGCHQPDNGKQTDRGRNACGFLLPIAQFLVFGSQLTFPHSRRQVLSAFFLCVYQGDISEWFSQFCLCDRPDGVHIQTESMRAINLI
jgi:hypothetical protein